MNLVRRLRRYQYRATFPELMYSWQHSLFVVAFELTPLPDIRWARPGFEGLDPQSVVIASVSD